MKWKKFYDRITACEEENFTTFKRLQATVLKVHAYAECGGFLWSVNRRLEAHSGSKMHTGI